MRSKFLKNKGFTLIEIMVAVSIFVIVALIVTSTVITTSETNRKAQAIKVAIDNLSFALDSMSLKMRQGNTFHCVRNLGSEINNITSTAELTPSNCASGGVGVAFLDPAGDKYVYVIDNLTVKFWKTGYGSGLGNFVSITDSSLIDITAMKFYAWNTQTIGDPPQPLSKPRVAVVLSGRTKDPKLATEFYLQTTASGK